MLQWRHDDAMVMLWWCHGDVMMMLQWCYDDDVMVMLRSGGLFWGEILAVARGWLARVTDLSCSFAVFLQTFLGMIYLCDINLQCGMEISYFAPKKIVWISFYLPENWGMPSLPCSRPLLALSYRARTSDSLSLSDYLTDERNLLRTYFWRNLPLLPNSILRVSGARAEIWSSTTKKRVRPRKKEQGVGGWLARVKPRRPFYRDKKSPPPGIKKKMRDTPLPCSLGPLLVRDRGRVIPR